MLEEADKPPLLGLFDERLKTVPRLVPACETPIPRLLDAVQKNPYSGSKRLNLAREYTSHGYPDLAAGEAYMALLLFDEIENPDSEYYDSSILAAAWDMSCDDEIDEEGLATSMEDEKRRAATLWAKENICRTSYAILVESLIHCGCIRSALQFCDRGLVLFPNDDLLLSLGARMLPKDKPEQSRADVNRNELPDRSFVRREVYPWNQFEPDRYSPQFIELVNESMSRLAPCLEVRVTELIDLKNDDPASRIKQLGVFAKEDLPPGRRIFSESSILTAAARMDDDFCDGCCAPLTPQSPSHEQCPDCDAMFCSAGCFAGSVYHPIVCGMDVDSLSRDAPPEEAADALYSRLLFRSLAIAASRDQHPLEEQPLMLICGDFDRVQSHADSSSRDPADPFHGRPRGLPFSFHSNILLPLNILEKMDVNVFTTPWSSTWVANTIYAKIRATASARQNARGRPEIVAVHPVWCLANHSCDPNVEWNWSDTMTFTVRNSRVKWAGKDCPQEAGITKDQEILSHYCDVGLPVKERREWAAGALGGHCRCERCLWESRHDVEEC